MEAGEAACTRLLLLHASFGIRGTRDLYVDSRRCHPVARYTFFGLGHARCASQPLQPYELVRRKLVKSEVLEHLAAANVSPEVVSMKPQSEL